MELWTYEQESWAQGCETVCGVDEAGAGPLMGPVYAAAVILPRECVIDGLNDSKKLTEKKREALYSVITETALAWSVASVSAAEIDATDILSARMKAMQPGSREACRHHHAPPLYRRRRRPLRFYRGGVHSGQGQP